MAKKRRLKGASKLEFEIGSGNIYKDLGYKDADAAQISRIIPRAAVDADGCRNDSRPESG